MKELFSFGHFSIYFFGLTVALGALVGILLASREAKRLGIAEDPFFDVLLFGFVGGIVGARLVYILVYDPAYYWSNPLEVFFINNGGLSIHGGILGGVLSGIWRIKKHQLSLWKIADVVAPALILGQAIGRVGCDVFGVPMTTPYFWGVEIEGTLLHPAQVYEFVLDYLLFAYLWLRRHSASYQGQIFVHYLIGFSLIRGLVEFFRFNPTVFGFLSVSHLLSLLAIAFSLVLGSYLKRNYPLARKLENTSSPLTTIITTLILIVISLAVYYFVQG